MNNLPTNSPALDYSDRHTLDLLKKTVAQGTTDQEFALFVQHCRATGLNPFKREIWCIKTADRVQIMTGINGYYEIANRHPQFDGIEVEVLPKTGKPEVAIARVYRKDRSRPTTAEAYFEEYAKAYGNWKTMPRLMLSKCAESMALRKAFPQELNGIYTDAEMPREYAAEPVGGPIETQQTTEPNVQPVINSGTWACTTPANERIESDILPDQYRLEAPRSVYRGKTLAEIHAKDPGWIPATLNHAQRRASCTKRDLVNLEAFYDRLRKPECREPSEEGVGDEAV